MKKSIYCLLMVAFCAIKTQAQQYNISNWLNKKTACAVLTYDDWLDGHGAIVIDQLIDKNMVASFYINSDWADRSGGYDTMMYAVNHGIEIGNHTAGHLDLANENDNSMRFQIKSAKDSINLYVTNQKCLTLAYPFGSYNNNVIDYVEETHIAARSVWGKWYWNSNWIYDFTEPANVYFQVYKPYYEITTYEITTNTSTLDIGAELTNAINNGGLITFMLHEIYNGSVGNPGGVRCY